MSARFHVATLPLFLAGLLPALAADFDWPRFRGPNGSGIATGAQPPTTWSDTQNVKWRTELPGAGTLKPGGRGRTRVRHVLGRGWQCDAPVGLRKPRLG